MNNSRERKWLFESMLKQLKTRDGEDIYPGDVADYVDEVLYEKSMNTQPCLFIWLIYSFIGVIT